MPEFRPINPEDKLFDELSPLLIGIGPQQNLLCYGTCFIAYPHMAITAKHVVAELLSQDPEIERSGNSTFEYWIVQVAWRGDDFDYVVWTIHSICMSAHSDIAIIWLRPYDQNADTYKRTNKWKTVPLTFDPPAIGEKVTAFGIHNVRFDGSRVTPEGKFEHIEMKSDKSISSGIVKSIYWDRRDSALYNFPCFEVDAKFESGMSGGLVINEKSQVCGIVSGSLHATSADEPHVSYVTMLWPMMAIPVGPELVEHAQEGQNYVLRDLSARGVFTPEGWDRVLITPIAGGGSSIQFRRKS